LGNYKLSRVKVYRKTTLFVNNKNKTYLVASPGGKYLFIKVIIAPKR